MHAYCPRRGDAHPRPAPARWPLPPHVLRKCVCSSVAESSSSPLSAKDEHPGGRAGRHVRALTSWIYAKATQAHSCLWAQGHRHARHKLVVNACMYSMQEWRTRMHTAPHITLCSTFCTDPVRRPPPQLEPPPQHHPTLLSSPTTSPPPGQNTHPLTAPLPPSLAP